MIHRSPRMGALAVTFALGLGCTGNITNGGPRGAGANNPGAVNQGTAGAGVVQMQAADPSLPAAGRLRS